MDALERGIMGQRDGYNFPIPAFPSSSSYRLRHHVTHVSDLSWVDSDLDVPLRGGSGYAAKLIRLMANKQTLAMA